MKPNITKEEKEYFVCFYLREQKQYLKLRKIKNIATVISLVAFGVAGVLSFVSLPSAYILFATCGGVAIPTFLNIHYKMQDVIEKACIGNITYRVFKKMFKSGELQELIDEHNKMIIQPTSKQTPKFSQKKELKQNGYKSLNIQFIEKSSNNERTR